MATKVFIPKDRQKAGVVSSGVITSDVAICAKACAVYWLTISDTAEGACQLNNSTDDSGTDLWGAYQAASTLYHVVFDPPIPFDSGLFLDVSTGTPDVIVGFAPSG